MKRWVAACMTAALMGCDPPSFPPRTHFDPSEAPPSTPSTTPPAAEELPALPSGGKEAEWQPLGDSQSRYPPQQVNEASIALMPDGTPLVAWDEQVYDGPTMMPPWTVRVSRWSGSEWMDLGGDLRSPTAHSAGHSSLLVDRVTGTPIMAWSSIDSSGGGGHFRVQAWDGSNWLPMGQELVTTQHFHLSVAASLAQDKEGHLWVAWSWSCPACSASEGSGRLEVARWNGTSWEELPNPPTVDAASLDLKVDASGHPVLAVAVANDNAIRAYRWDETAGWNDLGEVARVHLPTYSLRLSLALDATQAPAVAWFDALSNGSDSGRITVKQWDGHGWRSLGAFHTKAEAVTLSATPDGTLLLGHSEGILAWDGAAWKATTAAKTPVDWYWSSALFTAPDGTLYGASVVGGGIQVRRLK